MADFDEFVRRNSEIMGLSKPVDRDVTNLRNWLNATGSISWAESDYLNHRDDLVSVSPIGPDAAGNQLEVWVEDIIPI
ncbi:hypothetical protein CEP53_007931 [Fusarium sp. AF-6]|nr:hypothetical protein CEP53_007931 [Fusarium sp. AF-6]